MTCTDEVFGRHNAAVPSSSRFSEDPHRSAEWSSITEPSIIHCENLIRVIMRVLKSDWPTGYFPVPLDTEHAERGSDIAAAIS